MEVCFVSQTFEAAIKPGRCHSEGIHCSKRLILQTWKETEMVLQTWLKVLEHRKRATFHWCNEQVGSEDKHIRTFIEGVRAGPLWGVTGQWTRYRSRYSVWSSFMLSRQFLRTSAWSVFHSLVVNQKSLRLTLPSLYSSWRAWPRPVWFWYALAQSMCLRSIIRVSTNEIDSAAGDRSRSAQR